MRLLVVTSSQVLIPQISQTENELGSKLRVAGVYVLPSVLIPLIIVFLINQLLSSLGVWRKLQMNEEWCSKYE